MCEFHQFFTLSSSPLIFCSAINISQKSHFFLFLRMLNGSEPKKAIQHPKKQSVSDLQLQFLFFVWKTLSLESKYIEQLLAIYVTSTTYFCFVHPIFRISFLVAFGSKVIKIRKYLFCILEKNQIENQATKVTKIPKTKRRTYGMNETFVYTFKYSMQYILNK